MWVQVNLKNPQSEVISCPLAYAFNPERAHK